MTLFLSFCFAGSIGLSIAVLAGGESLQKVGFVAMFIPALAVLAVKYGAKQPIEDAGWKRLPLGYVPLALLVLPIVIHAAGLPLLVILGGSIPWGELPTVPRFVVNMTLPLMLVTSFSLFEELGWRAWLLPRLVARSSVKKALILSSAIWAAWHVPFVLSGIQSYGDGVPTAAAVLIQPIGHIGAGIFIGWLWLKTRSIWIVSLAHGALNNWGQLAFKYIDAPVQHELPLLIVVNGALLAAGGVTLLRAADRPS